MAESNIQINALPQATTPLSDADIFHCKQGIVDKRVTLADLLFPHSSLTNNPHNVTKAQVGLGNVTNDEQLVKAQNLGDLPNVEMAQQNLNVYSKEAVDSVVQAHINDKNNPHNTTKSQVGLGNVENYTVALSYTDASANKYVTAKVVNDLYKMIQGMYPIGHRIYTDNSANPSTYIPVGTWALTGQGRVSVGYDAGNSSRPAGTKFGSSTVTIDVANLPAHTHGVTVTGGNHSHGASGSTTGAGAHNHVASGNTGYAGDHNHTYTTTRQGGGNPGNHVGHGSNEIHYTNEATGVAGGHTHYVSLATNTVGDHAHGLNININASGNLSMSGTSNPTGSGQALTIEQPSEVVYIWKRVS
ncbi:putative tail fiber protein [Erwinia phage phiEa21-4]|uniref:Putative tail fiber protein n=1 Tax=Erwinia phage phiEa21-4 TaxID=557393 RepID=B8QTW7_9CAUD|nr:putative tail fiber protein [Erwinia phage phiEa21-4]ACH88982.1 putative tail fiber protein [Erwinia phage phiEa21-4]